MKDLSKIVKNPIFIVIAVIQLIVFPLIWLWIDVEQKEMIQRSKNLIEDINRILNSNINIKIDVNKNVIKRYHEEKFIDMLEIKLFFPQVIYPLKYQKYQKEVGRIDIKKEALLELSKIFKINRFYIDVKITKDDEKYTIPIKQSFRIISGENSFEIVEEVPIITNIEDNNLQENINRIKQELENLFSHIIKDKRIPVRLYFDATKVIENTIEANAVITISFEPTKNEIITREINHPVIIMPSNYRLDNKDIALMVNPYYLSDVFRNFLMVDGSNKFEIARNMFYAMRALGIRYAYSAASTDVLGQYIQPPHYTLLTGTGQCTDLSLLYATMLESFNIPTAFVFVSIPAPHVFVMFSVNEDEIPQPFRNYMIKYRLSNYLPVETTWVDNSFLNAVRSGWSQYRSQKKNEDINVVEFESEINRRIVLNYRISDREKDKIIKKVDRGALRRFLNSRD